MSVYDFLISPFSSFVLLPIILGLLFYAFGDKIFKKKK